MANSEDRPMPRVAGPGADPAGMGISPNPMLEGATEFEYVDIHNPLSVDFAAKFAVTKPAVAPLRIGKDNSMATITETESDLRNNYQLNLRNPDFQGRVNVENIVIIPAGKTKRFLGNEAQVVCRQLVNELMQREGKALFLADAHARHDYEGRVVKGRGRVDALLGTGGLVTVQDQLAGAIKEPTYAQELEFEDVTAGAGTGAPEADEASQPSERATEQSQSRGPGRPRKAQAVN